LLSAAASEKVLVLPLPLLIASLKILTICVPPAVAKVLVHESLVADTLVPPAPLCIQPCSVSTPTTLLLLAVFLWAAVEEVLLHESSVVTGCSDVAGNPLTMLLLLLLLLDLLCCAVQKVLVNASLLPLLLDSGLIHYPDMSCYQLFHHLQLNMCWCMSYWAQQDAFLLLIGHAAAAAAAVPSIEKVLVHELLVAVCISVYSHCRCCCCCCWTCS
jgi:hypothetical protein